MDVLWLVLLGLGLLVSLVLAGSWLLARLWCWPERLACQETPGDRGLDYEEVALTSQGARLRGWFIPPAAQDRPWPAVVLAHGWSHNAGRMLPLASRLHQAGLAVLLFDARGHGRSPADGPITLGKFAQDVAAALDYLRARPEVDQRRLALVGHSLGGAAALVAASWQPDLKAVVSTSAFADPRWLVRGTLRGLHLPNWPFLWLMRYIVEGWLGTSMSSIAPRNRVGDIQAPLLLMHGAADQFIPPANLEAIYARAPKSRTSRQLMEGAGHSDLLQDPRCQSMVLDFLGSHLLATLASQGRLAGAAT